MIPHATTAAIAPNITFRWLAPGDEPKLEVFLSAYLDSSMIMLSNLGEPGLQYTDLPYQGVYMAAIDEATDSVVGVLVHYWNGMITMQAPDLHILRHLALLMQQDFSRCVAGVIGL